jgi:hypothetical protein
MVTSPGGIGWAAESRPPGSHRGRWRSPQGNANPRGPQPGGSLFSGPCRGPFRWKSRDFQRAYEAGLGLSPERGPGALLHFLDPDRSSRDEPAKPARRRNGTSATAWRDLTEPGSVKNAHRERGRVAPCRGAGVDLESFTGPGSVKTRRLNLGRSSTSDGTRRSSGSPRRRGRRGAC